MNLPTSRPSQDGNELLTRTDAVPLQEGAEVSSALQDASSLVRQVVAQKQFPILPSIESEQLLPAPAAVLVFSAGDQKFSATDVVEAAWFRGDLQVLWQEFLLGAAGEQSAEQEGLEPENEILQALSDEFRTNHDLITAEETECWLAARGLTLNDFNDHFHRQYWRQHATIPDPSADIDYANAEPDDQQRFLTDVLFSDKFDGLARRLSWSVAASVVTDRPETSSSDSLEVERSRFFQRTDSQPEQLSDCLQLIGRDRAWFERMVALEAGYRWHCDQLFTPENRARTLAALRLPLTRFEVEMIDLESEDAVREAFLCLDADGLSMKELAGQEGYVIENRELLLEEFPEELQQRFLSSETGQVFQVFNSDQRFQLYRVLGKSDPTLADGKVIERVDAELLASHFGNVVSKHIVWLIGRDTPA
jgi:hypothetical protein